MEIDLFSFSEDVFVNNAINNDNFDKSEEEAEKSSKDLDHQSI